MCQVSSDPQSARPKIALRTFIVTYSGRRIQVRLQPCLGWSVEMSQFPKWQLPRLRGWQVLHTLLRHSKSIVWSISVRLVWAFTMGPMNLSLRTWWAFPTNEAATEGPTRNPKSREDRRSLRWTSRCSFPWPQCQNSAYTSSLKESWWWAHTCGRLTPMHFEGLREMRRNSDSPEGFRSVQERLGTPWSHELVLVLILKWLMCNNKPVNVDAIETISW